MFTVSAVCCSSFRSIQERKWNFANSPVGIYRCPLSQFAERLRQWNLLQLWESVNVTSVGLNGQNSVDLKAYLIMKFEAQCTLCKRTLNLGTLGVKALVSHTKSEKHQLASKNIQQSHAITHIIVSLYHIWCRALLYFKIFLKRS